MSELYNDLRQVHRRLEQDLRGVRDSEFPALGMTGIVEDTAEKTAVEVHTNVRSDNINRAVEPSRKQSDRLPEDDAVRRLRRDEIQTKDNRREKKRHEWNRARGECELETAQGSIQRRLSDHRDKHSSANLVDNDYIALNDGRTSDIDTASQPSDMFCLAPVHAPIRRESGDHVGHVRSVRRQGRRSEETPEEYQRKEGRQRLDSVDKRVR